MKKFIKKLLADLWLDSLLITILSLVLFLVFIFPHLRDFIFWLLDSLWLHDNYKINPEFFSVDPDITEKQKADELHNQFIYNFSSIAWTIISVFALLITFGLTIWGRIMQKWQWEIHKDQWETQEKQWRTQNETHQLQLESHLHNRYEKAASMLESEIVTVRIAGCRALRSLGIDDGKMKVQCVRLLFSFINNPYLETRDKGKKLDKVFPYDKALRDDIQEAADSFSEIYEKYKDEGIDREEVILPDYFLKNKYAKPISLIRANLMRVNYANAYLKQANLQGSEMLFANLNGVKMREANLQETKMRGTKLQKAELWDSDMQDVDLRSADLRGAYLSNANLDSAYLQGANLGEANLSSVNFSNADLWGTNLVGALLNRTNFMNADLSLSELREINFEYTNLSNVNLSDSDLTKANMEYVTGLTKEQIVSALWGYYQSGEGGPPRLPEELLNDPEVQEWLSEPHYDHRKEEEEEEENNNDDDDI